MTFLSHAYMGAVAYRALGQLIGLDADVAAPVLGALLGAAPDVLDFPARFWYPKWFVKDFLHGNRLALIIQAMLIAPGLHHLFDQLIHEPILPRPSNFDDGQYGYVLIEVYGHTITRRDVHWLMGESLLVALATLLLVLT